MDMEIHPNPKVFEDDYVVRGGLSRAGGEPLLC